MKDIKPEELAARYDWCGDEIITLLLNTLTECNYHTEVRTIKTVLTINI